MLLRTRTIRPLAPWTAALALALLCLAGGASTARADELTELARTLRSGRQEKARLAAVVAIGRLRDPRAAGPLLQALDDSSPLVRAVAATALGHLGERSAIPALEKLREDPDGSVRKRAVESLYLLEKRDAAGAPAQHLPSRFKLSAREQPRVPGTDAKPPLRLVIKNVTDRSAAQATPIVRKRRADKMRSVLTAELAANPVVQLDSEAIAADPSDGFSIDGTITRFQRRVRGPYVEVVCEIQISVYNGSGKMLSFVSGGAFVQVPAQTFEDKYEADMRLEALEGAVRGVHPNLIAYLESEREK